MCALQYIMFIFVYKLNEMFIFVICENFVILSLIEVPRPSHTSIYCVSVSELHKYSVPVIFYYILMSCFKVRTPLRLF